MTSPDDPRKSERWDRLLGLWLKVVNLVVACVKLAKMVL